MANQNKALLCGLTAVFAWSTVATAFKLTLLHVDVYQMLFIANVASVVALGCVLLFQKKFSAALRLTRSHYLYTCALGLLNPFVYYLVLFRAYDLLPAQIAQPINFTWALTMTWLAVPMLGQRLRGRDYIAAAVCYSGVLVLTTGGSLSGFNTVNLLGVALALVSTLIWAFYWILNTRNKLEPVIGLFLGFLFSLPAVVLVTVLFSDFKISLPGLTGGIYIGFFEMGFTFVLWLTAMRLTTSTARIANLIFLAPFLSLIFINYILHEPVVPATFIGLILIVSGLFYQNKPNKNSVSDV